MVKQYGTFDSAADVGSRKRPRPIEGDTVFRCSRCVTDNEFVSRKALLAHATKKHGDRVEVRRFVGADARCPVCLHQFSTRLRAIAHLSEKGLRGKALRTCHDAVTAGGYPQLDAETLSSLDAVDREVRKKARRAGVQTPWAGYYAGRSKIRAQPDQVLPLAVPARPPRRGRCKTTMVVR